MGESACLMRSFSSPSKCSSEVKEGDPLRCLGESISFGRYMSEPLAWEKWSAFSHNRYLEEVEKFSKPGSVAQKKAYFEAHYKRKAAEKAAALLEVTNASASNVSESVNMYKNCDSFSNIESANGESHMVVDKQQENFVPNSEVVICPADMSAPNPNVEGNQLDVSMVDGAEAVVQESVNLANPVQVEISNKFENDKDQDEIVATQEEKIPNKEAAGEENLASTNKKRLINSSPRLSTKGRASKAPISPAKQATRVQTIKGKNVTQKGKKFSSDLVDKRRLTGKSLHMSIHFTSHAGESETSKITSPVVEKTRNSRSYTTMFNISMNKPASRQSTARASVNGVLKQSSADLWSIDRREKTLLNKSVAGAIADGIWTSSSKDQFSTANGSKPRPPIASCPFIFKSQERAEKRKEFFQRLEEKKNAKEAENKQLQLRSNKKEKAVGDVNKLRQCAGLKAKLNQDLSSGSQFPSNHLNKIPLAQPRSPKLGRQSTLSKALDPSSRPAVNSHSSNFATKKYKVSTNRSVPSLLKKNAHENSPPNIQS
ncbi:protein WVD2-like 7 [Prunus avium]|uniref:Protein WVD2-like 7 n=1 Tax=Prunus avium TaxID=42229 RepID=A0A6P5U109_PRUAV|nr:protein WVD2-like 7 [Prunus avium]